jgi:hypothetical protein
VEASPSHSNQRSHLFGLFPSPSEGFGQEDNQFSDDESETDESSEDETISQAASRSINNPAIDSTPMMSTPEPPLWAQHTKDADRNLDIPDIRFETESTTDSTTSFGGLSKYCFVYMHLIHYCCRTVSDACLSPLFHTT